MQLCLPERRNRTQKSKYNIVTEIETISINPNARELASCLSRKQIQGQDSYLQQSGTSTSHSTTSTLVGIFIASSLFSPKAPERAPIFSSNSPRFGNFAISGLAFRLGPQHLPPPRPGLSRPTTCDPLLRIVEFEQAQRRH